MPTKQGNPDFSPFQLRGIHTNENLQNLFSQPSKLNQTFNSYCDTSNQIVNYSTNSLKVTKHRAKPTIS